MLGAGLMQALQQRYPDARFVGVGGPRMLALGFESVTPMERLSVMGFIEPLFRLRELQRLKRDLVALFQRERPAVFIGIDSPGFNLRLEEALHKVGVRTVHYVSPSVWAWGQKRIHTIKRSVDLMLALFPFETDIYHQHEIPVVCVGHPLADQILPAQDQDELRREARNTLQLASEPLPAQRLSAQPSSAQAPSTQLSSAQSSSQPSSQQWICVMPGSRHDEVKRLAPVFLDAALACVAQRPSLGVIIPCANPERRKQIDELLSVRAVERPELIQRFRIVDGQSHLAMQAADLVMMASGTATLEAMLLKRPMIVAYRMSRLTWLLASRLVKVPYVSLPNLLARRQLVPEYLQDAVTVDALRETVDTWLDQPEHQQELVAAFEDIHHSLRLDANLQAARAISALIESAGGGESPAAGAL